MVDEAQWTKLVQDNTNAITKNSEILTQIRDEFKEALRKYDTFGRSLIVIVVLMGVAVALLGAMFLAYLFAQ